MSNQLEKLEKVELSQAAQYQVDLVKQVDKATQEMGQGFTEYGRQCVINAIANLFMVCKNTGINFGALDISTVKVALQNVGFTELNFNAIPSEAYYDIRKVWTKDKTGKTVCTHNVSVKPQGAGNEKLTRRFGLNVKELKSCILVREGDEFTLPGFDGEKMTPFKWTPKSYDKKVIMVVYPLVKTDGTYEYLIATRESIKPNLIAQIRQNNLYTFKTEDGKDVDTAKRDAFYEEVNRAFEEMTVDQILADPKWRKELTPTYTSGGSVEAMILRKMKNNALKNYPREFDSAAMAQAVMDMYEDRDDSLTTKKEVVDVDMVAKVEEELEDKADADALQDFDVNENGEVKGIEPPVHQAKEEPKYAEGNPRVPETEKVKATDSYEEDL